MRLLAQTSLLFSLTFILLDAQPSSDMKGGGPVGQQASCLPEAMRDQIKKDIAQNLIIYGLDRKRANGSVPTDLIFPLIMPEVPEGYFHFSAISGFTDQDASSPGILDYDCQENTYDGHDGTDYFTFPFKWFLVEQDLVHVVSATAGHIILKNDGNPHLNCERRGNWNAVYIQHDDGSQFWYGHLKAGSLTTKSVGDRVSPGEYLGVVASSGYSNAPHLHLECYDKDGNLLDPYAGPCNTFNDFSMWHDQRPYVVPQINALLTHSKEPRIDCEANNEVSALSNTFYLGDTMYAGIYITDYQKDDIITTDVLRPDGSLYATFNSFSFENSYESFWNWRRYFLTNNDPEGIWTVQASYKDVQRNHYFEYIKEITNTTVKERGRPTLFPNPTRDLLRIEGLDKLGGFYQIFDVSGQVLETSLLENHWLNLAEFQAGIYFLQISQGRSQWITKLMVIN